MNMIARRSRPQRKHARENRNRAKTEEKTKEQRPRRGEARPKRKRRQGQHSTGDYQNTPIKGLWASTTKRSSGSKKKDRASKKRGPQQPDTTLERSFNWQPREKKRAKKNSQSTAIRKYKPERGMEKTNMRVFPAVVTAGKRVQGDDGGSQSQGG